MRYLLDTCIILELPKQNPDPNVVKWIRSQHETDFCLSVLTFGEIQKGISKLVDSEKKILLQEWLNFELKTRFENRILEISGSIAQKWGEIQGCAEQRGNKMPVIDSLIAATGLVHNLTVVTRNIDDMKQSGVTLLNPWN